MRFSITLLALLAASTALAQAPAKPKKPAAGAKKPAAEKPAAKPAPMPAPAEAPPAPLDVTKLTSEEISERAAQLEAELGKLRDTSPDAAELLLQLIELYHADARVFGLVRAGENFVSHHSNHPRHKEAMLKLIDGFVGTSRNKETVAMCRQFLARYPDDAACAHLEMLLATTLEQLGDRQQAAEAHEAVWRRQPTSDVGRNAGVAAITHYAAVNNLEGFTGAAKLAEAMLQTYPAGKFAALVGNQAVYNWIRANEWAKSNAAAAALLKKGLPTEPEALRLLHVTMGENFGRLGQWSNAVQSYQQARAIQAAAPLDRLIILAMYQGAAKGAELEPLVTEYFQKYPTQADRFELRSYVAAAYFRDMDKPKALAILKGLLAYDAVSLSNAQTFVRENGAEPAQLADTEQVLLDAIGKNALQAGYLRFALGFDLYRDRLKDVAKAKAAMRDLLTKSPTNDGYSSQAIYWLLSNAADDSEFQADVQMILKVRTDRFAWTNLRSYFPEWVKQAAQDANLQARAAWAKARLDESNEQPLIKDWLASETDNRPVAEAARIKLLAPDNQPNLNDEQARALFTAQSSSYMNSPATEERARAAGVYAAMAKRFPKDYQVAYSWLYAATLYNPPEVSTEAMKHVLELEPVADPSNYDVWYRLAIAADRAADPNLVRQFHAWLLRSQQVSLPDIRYADSIGDILEKYELKQEALDWWRKTVPVDYNNSYSRTCAQRIADRLKGEERTKFIQDLLKIDCDFHGTYAMWLADDALKSGEPKVYDVKAADLKSFEQFLAASRTTQAERPFRNWGMEEYPPQTWVDQYRASKDATPEDKRRVFVAVRDLRLGRTSAAAQLALLELEGDVSAKPLDRILAYQAVTTLGGHDYLDWDRLVGYAQAAMARKDYTAVAALVGGLLANIPNLEAGRLKSGRDMVAQSYARMGAVGLSIDENSPIAPLQQAALYLRLGDTRLALESYTANKDLFDQHRDELPVDLILFVCDSHIAAGGDENFERAEDILRGWLVKFSEAMDLDNSVKAQVQLLLAKDYYKSQRYDVARSEYTTVINRYPETPEAIEAEFGIGESFMAQKVYDQAEAAFEKLAGSRDRDVVIRAEFLRGVLANRRGDLDEARDIFRGVLEMVPNVELANQALYNLAEVYGAEQRYMDQLELLRTVGRLGRRSKRWHTPGIDLSIVVQDSDLGISRGHAKIPVRVTTQPGGDEELIYLYSGGAGKGLFRADLETRLGKVAKGNQVLELTGQDTILCDYPEEFKAEFRSVPLSDAEIRIAADGKFEVASGKIIDKEKETFSERLEREAREEREKDERISQNRPANQIKPGNPIYMRTIDADRDLTDEVDKISIKLTATSGDQVQVPLTETGAHTGIFEGSAETGELPAGALASNTAIDHSPLMAIDQDPGTAWLSEPDGATPKWLWVDMKDLRTVDHVTISTPDPNQHAPVRGMLEGSQDGRFWFRLAEIPTPLPLEDVAAESEEMTARVYAGYYLNLTTWQQVVDLSKNGKPIEQETAEQLSWNRAADAPDAASPHAVLWHGKCVQPRDGAVRFAVAAARSALAIDGSLELAFGDGPRTVDVWLARGTHNLTIFAALGAATQGAVVTRAREDNNAEQVVLSPFRASDFDLKQALAKPALPRAPAVLKTDNGVWDFRIDPLDLRHVRLTVHEYLGESLAINHVEISGEEEAEKYIPTKADVLALAGNDKLEIAAGDVITATYTDEFTQSASGRSQLLTGTLTATYFNARLVPISYDFVRLSNGAVDNVRKQLIRIDPGERFIVEITDYDRDTSAQPDALEFQVAVNDGEPIKLTAQETQPHSGIFTKEVDTAAAASEKAEGQAGPADGNAEKPKEKPEAKGEKETGGAAAASEAAAGKPAAEGKLAVKRGDRLYCAYLDEQNTFPGHSIDRETVVYVNQPSDGRVRIVETRIVPPPKDNPTAPVQIIYSPVTKDKKDKEKTVNVAFEAPFTVEVFDRDQAKDSRSTVTVALETTDGAKVEVECAVSSAFSGIEGAEGTDWALEEGRFIGQVIMQLGSKNSQDVVPLSSNMPRNLIGKPKIPDEQSSTANEALVTRVLNVAGKDVIQAAYNDAARRTGKPRDLTGKGRLIANGVLACTDREYEKPVTQLHVGEKLFLKVSDADLDVSDERDSGLVEVTSERGEKETVELLETLAHSGVFTGSVQLRPAESPTAANLSKDDPAIETFFGDTLRMAYLDKAASTETGELESKLELPVVVGTDGLVAAFSKAFGDESLAVETQFYIAESYFELFKSHKKLESGESSKRDLEAGRRILREVMEDYPDPKYVPRTAYLLGQFAQELQQWNEAIDAYKMIVRQYPDHSLAVDAQYKMAQCYEEAGNFDEALEAYVTLAATYPKSPLIANVMIRISERFYKVQNYKVAAQVGEKFCERFEGHEWAPRMAFRVGQCYYKDKDYMKAASSFDKFVKIFPDDALAGDSLFWSGESYRMASNNSLAFRRYNRCRWDYPESDAAKYSRGRLALPAMLQQFEAEANVDEP